MEEQGELNRDDQIDLYCIHVVFLPKINLALEGFREAWNNHSLSTEHNQSPYQIWIASMYDGNKANQTGVRDVIDQDPEDHEFYGVSDEDILEEEDYGNFYRRSMLTKPRTA